MKIILLLTALVLCSCANKYGSAELGFYKPALPFEEGAEFGAFVVANPEAIITPSK